MRKWILAGDASRTVASHPYVLSVMATALGAPYCAEVLGHIESSAVVHLTRTPTYSRSLCQRGWGALDLDGGRQSGHQSHALRHLIQVDAHGNALCKANPGKDRIYRGQPLLVWLGVRDVDSTRNSGNMTANGLAIAHQLDRCGIAFVNRGKLILLKIRVHPE